MMNHDLLFWFLVFVLLLETDWKLNSFLQPTKNKSHCPYHATPLIHFQLTVLYKFVLMI